MFLVLLVSWLCLGSQDPAEYQVLEMFAGCARVSRLATACSLRAVAHDILFDDERHHHGKSCMNINEDAGFLFLGCIDLTNGRAPVINSRV